MQQEGEGGQISPREARLAPPSQFSRSNAAVAAASQDPERSEGRKTGREGGVWLRAGGEETRLRVLPPFTLVHALEGSIKNKRVKMTASLQRILKGIVWIPRGHFV